MVAPGQISGASRPALLRLKRITALSTLIILFTAFSPPVSGADSAYRDVKVRYVIDGDTVVLSSGERVRYVGIDAPEKGEPYHTLARRRNSALVSSGNVTLEVCGAEPRDKYGRTLAIVRAGGVDVGEALIKEGLARSLIIPPCGLAVAGRFKAAEREARLARRGIWSVDERLFSRRKKR